MEKELKCSYCCPYLLDLQDLFLISHLFLLSLLFPQYGAWHFFAFLFCLVLLFVPCLVWQFNFTSPLLNICNIL